MKLKMMSKSLAAITLLVAAPSWAVVVDGREWLQPADYTNLSWDAIDAQCPAPDRLCTSGPIAGIAGYTWASTAETTDMLASYGAPPPTTSEIGSSWAPAILDVFTPTYEGPNHHELVGWTSTPHANPALGSGIAIFDELDAGDQDSHQLVAHNAANPQALYGAMFFRVPSALQAVPAVGPYGLVITMFGLTIVALRRLSRRKTREG